jgi:hypothetical protein
LYLCMWKKIITQAKYVFLVVQVISSKILKIAKQYVFAERPFLNHATAVRDCCCEINEVQMAPKFQFDVSCWGSRIAKNISIMLVCQSRGPSGTTRDVIETFFSPNSEINFKFSLIHFCCKNGCRAGRVARHYIFIPKIL